MDEELLKRFREECFIRNLSPKTAHIYEYHINRFLDWNGNISVEDLTLYDARDYILEKRRDGVSTGYCNGINGALTFFYKRVLHVSWNYDIVPRMKVDWELPQTLTREQIEILIDTAENIRNKAIIALLYSSGLRVSEVVRLAPKDIHSDRMQVHVRNSKNHGDHWTVLSPRTLDFLRQYWLAYPEPRDILFVTLRKPYKPIEKGGVEIMLNKIGAEAGISVHPHTLRHSFATHLIENGVNREHVQAMLGHRSPSSTAIYVHVSNKSIMGIKSPFDMPLRKSEESDSEDAKNEE